MSPSHDLTWPHQLAAQCAAAGLLACVAANGEGPHTGLHMLGPAGWPALSAFYGMLRYLLLSDNRYDVPPCWRDTNSALLHAGLPAMNSRLPSQEAAAAAAAAPAEVQLCVSYRLEPSTAVLPFPSCLRQFRNACSAARKNQGLRRHDSNKDAWRAADNLLAKPRGCVGLYAAVAESRRRIYAMLH